jgi:glycosyltransferase involved in cell wall biosynthesis
VTEELLAPEVRSLPVPAPVADSEKVQITYIVGSLQDAGAERRTLELLKYLDRDRFAPSIIMMEETGVERAREWAAKIFVMGIPEAGNARWFKRSLPLARAVWRTRRQLVNWRSDVVHAMLPGPSILGGAAARMAGVPVIIGSRPCLTSLYHSQLGLAAFADRMAFRMAHLNLTNSLAASREMTSIGGCPSNTCHTIYNGVDTRRFHPALPRSWRSAMRWTDQNVVFGLIANFRGYKRHIDFVEAASMIVQRHPEARFVMVGADFGSRPPVLRRISELGLEDKIRVMDSDPFPEKIFAALDVYVCTSESEGFSNVILEAMACAKPVIATDVGGNPEAVVDRMTGFLVPCRDPRSIALAAEELLRDAGQRHRLGAMGRQRVEQAFSVERMVHLHEQLYLRLVSDWRKTAA